MQQIAEITNIPYFLPVVYISYNDPKRCTKETFLEGSAVHGNLFYVLGSTPRGTIDINLRSCVLNRHKLRQSQIATLPSQFVICRNLWSKPWRRKLSPTTLKTCSVYLGEYPCSLLPWIWKLTFLPILVLFHWYICLCVCISARKPIIENYTLWHNWHHCEKLRFEPSQIATVTNGGTTVAICDLSQFVIKALTWHIDSNNTENVFFVLGRVPMFTFDMNMKTYIFAHSGVISLVYLFVCMHISYKAHNRCTICDKSGFPAVAICDLSQSVIKSVPWQIQSNNIENVFCILRKVPMLILDRNLRGCVLTHFRIICHKFCV